ncbi:hypothetical protein F3Y22_tig00110198pilonHSYRG00036 [Hibiscus syriacus]|uniref:Pectinesterase inhibitor domain-containing protein n=1 Tax=Hibiscus syriacus TaxID=106335 RepID=A0A6A3BE97_HIBSY|nr:hypothetical protein F3Y22_tig00110198pilonHSYRG00036 [Hibiscus syriacus]
MLTKALNERTKRAITTATKMAADPKYSHDPTIVLGHNGCRRQYDDALDALTSHGCDSMVIAAKDHYFICDSGFQMQPDPIPDGVSPMEDEDPDTISPLAKINDKLTDIGDTILDIVDTIDINDILNNISIPPAYAPTTALAPVPAPSPQPSTVASNPQIRSYCHKTFEPDLCLTSIAQFFNGETDLQSLTVMLIKAMTERTKRAITAATEKAADPMYSHDPRIVSALKACRELYGDALKALKQAMDNIQVYDIDTVEDLVINAEDDYDKCDSGFAMQPDGVSPMADINEELQNFGGIVLDFADMTY